MQIISLCLRVSVVNNNMKELQEILVKISQFAPDEKAILATVVDVQGSGYRRAGARMLIDAAGKSIGTVSGGCLEADVSERAKKVLQTDVPTVVIYDTTQDENSIFGLGMGCRGVIRVLLESVTKESNVLKSFDSVIKNREMEVVATLIAGENNVNVGGRVFYNHIEQFNFVNLPNSFENLESLKADCLKIYAGENKSAVETYQTATGATEFFIERIAPPLNLLVFGAGFDALPVVRFAKELGWRVCVIDHRAAFANQERLPEADEIFVARVEGLDEKLFNDDNSVAVVLTHNYELDREILYRLLNSKCRYIGALGPKKRMENLIQEMRDEKRKFDERNLEKIHAPVGLDIGAETPEEIALAVVAEIKTALSNRRGGFLRERNGSING